MVEHSQTFLLNYHPVRLIFELSCATSGQIQIARSFLATPILTRLLGETKVLKLLSVNPEYPDAPREAIRRILGSPAGQPIDHSKIESIRMGTTVATNALLERKGTKTALCITKGFKELFQNYLTSICKFWSKLQNAGPSAFFKKNP